MRIVTTVPTTCSNSMDIMIWFTICGPTLYAIHMCVCVSTRTCINIYSNSIFSSTTFICGTESSVAKMAATHQEQNWQHDKENGQAFSLKVFLSGWNLSVVSNIYCTIFSLINYTVSCLLSCNSAGLFLKSRKNSIVPPHIYGYLYHLPITCDTVMPTFLLAYFGKLVLRYYFLHRGFRHI